MPSPLIVKKPYPSVENICPDARSLRIISPAYATAAGELNAIMLYTYHSLMFCAEGKEEAAELIESIAVAEMMHLRLLGQLIIALGAAPVFTANPPCMFNFYSAKYVTYSRTLRCMAEDGVRAERQAIRGYERMGRLLGDTRVRDITERICEDERLHLKAYEDILSSFKS